jgi:hypothetical protein
VGNTVANLSILCCGGRSRRVRHQWCTERRVQSVAVCASHVVDGVEVDDCVGNPNANSVTDVPDVRVKLDLRIGFGI